MINIKYLKIVCLTILISIFLPNINNAKEILIYADNISYDKDKNIVARGNAKIFKDNQLIISELIIYDQKDKKVILPSEFTLKDERNNYISGSNGFFSQNLNFGEFDNVKIKLNDGSRIIGKKGKRDGNVE